MYFEAGHFHLTTAVNEESLQGAKNNYLYNYSKQCNLCSESCKLIVTVFSGEFSSGCQV